MKSSLLGSLIATALAVNVAQAYPTKPIRMVVISPPGGTTDILSRALAQQMTETLGQTVVTDNRPGGGGILASEIVARSTPDGHTLLYTHTSHSVLPSLHKKLPYDTLKDFQPVALVALFPGVLVVHPALPLKNVKELIALAKAKPGQINYGSTGTGGHNHLATELFRRMANINIVHVPYKGVAPALTDLMGGHTQLVMTSLPSALTQVQAGRLKALAVGSEQRSSFLPNLPTIAETVPGYAAEFWWGIAVPAKTPPDIVNRLGTELARALQSAEVKQRFAAEGAEPATMGREPFTKFVANEITRWRKVAQESGIKPE